MFQELRRVSPEAFHRWAGRMGPGCGHAAVVLVALGLVVGLALASTVPPQGETSRVAALHYPAAWTSLGVYLAIGALSAITLAHDSRVAAMLAAALAPTGALFTLLALWTEALWRKPLRGVWWAWDAEAIAQLLLLFLYAGFIGLKSMIDDPRRGERSGALLAVLGVANLPVIYFSLHWWDVMRHEAARAVTPPMTPSLLAAAALLGAGFAAYVAHAALKRVRCLIAERDALTRSLRRLPENAA